MIILHITDIAVKEGNGVTNAVLEYLKYESKDNKVAVYNLSAQIESNFCSSFNYKQYSNINSLPTPFNNPDIVIFNEVYKLKYIHLSKECNKRNIKYVIIPHGCLTDDARRKKGTWLKKQIALKFVLRKFIKNATAIQFLNVMEKNNTHIKYKNYIISGNGIKIEIKNNSCKSKNIIYIGRYDVYHKGLDYLVEMCKKYHDWFIKNKIKIYLYGRDSKGSLNILNDLIDKYSVGDVLIVNGAIYGKEKEELLKKSYAFIQTSRFEGQPMGILEALGYGVPCIVTKGTSFAEYVNENKCGFGSELDIDIIFNNLKKILNDEDLRNTFSKNAIKSIKRDFDWDVVIKDCVKKYQDLLSQERNIAMKKFNWESMRLRKNKFLRDVFSNFRRKKLKSEKFTIISNNCWGGTIYESYNIKKQSPTVGLFFESSDYIKFITNIKEYLKIELSFIDYNKSKRYKKGLNDNCIVGLLDDIEIYFLHYSSQEEALEKWNRRITRINYDRILFKFNDQNGCTEQNVVDFLKLPYKNKIFFTVNNYNIKDDRIIVLKKIKGQNNVMASQEPFGKSKYIDVTDLINNL